MSDGTRLRARILTTALAVCCAASLRGQDAAAPADTAAAAQAQTTARATLHGVVRNGLTGSPLARALVRIDGDNGSGALTDGEGRFEIPDVATGLQAVSVIKPGFVDEFAELEGRGSLEFGHTVVVEAEMPDVVLGMAPANAIRGQILLSSGEPAQGIAVVLLRQTVTGGRLLWQMENRTNTNADGVYRFGGLSDGLYAIQTELAMESGPDNNYLVATGSAASVVRSGYPGQFYPDAQDLNGAAKIHVKGGETAEADVSLTLKPFHTVTATVSFPGGRQPRETESRLPGIGYAATITDAEGHQLDYEARYDPGSNLVQALVPDGAYRLMLAATGPRLIQRVGGNISVVSDPGSFIGWVDVSVAGHSVANLRVPLAAARSAPVQVTLTRSGAAAAPALWTTSDGQEAVILNLTDAAGSIENGRGIYAEGPVSGPLQAAFTQPGSYWVHTSLHDKSVCEGSLTAGGANLGREPLVLGLNGASEPLMLNLRDDCATLTVALPAALTAQTAGEEPLFTVYVVPDFDSTVDVIPQTLSAATGATVTLHGLTPGRYHVYAFDKPTELAYRNRDALAALPNPGQEIDLEPGAKANLVVEVAKQ